MNCFYILISSLPFTPLRPGVHVYTSLKLLWQRPAAIFLISKFNRFFFPVLLIVPKEVNNILEILPQPLVKTFSWFFFYLSITLLSPLQPILQMLVLPLAFTLSHSISIPWGDDNYSYQFNSHRYHDV